MLGPSQGCIDQMLGLTLYIIKCLGVVFFYVVCDFTGSNVLSPSKVERVSILELTGLSKLDAQILHELNK